MHRSELGLETWKQQLKTTMIRDSVGVGVSVAALTMKAHHTTPFVHSLMPKANTHMLWARFVIDNSDMNCGQRNAMSWEKYLIVLCCYTINSIARM
jgi:hypothetical protein